MFQTKNSTRKALFILPVMCAAMTSMAFADDELQPLAKKNRGAAPLFLTATNGPVNYLAVVNSRTQQTNYVPTGGNGEASGNAGGVAGDGKIAAVVNFGSTNVAIFVRRGDAMEPTQLIKTASQPVSVAFGHNHLVVLELTARIVSRLWEQRREGCRWHGRTADSG